MCYFPSENPKMCHFRWREQAPALPLQYKVFALTGYYGVVFLQKLRKIIDKSGICGKIVSQYAKTAGKPSIRKVFSERGLVRALCRKFCKPLILVARDDRDGCSRYRAAKMPLMRRIRVVPRNFTPLSYDRGGLFFMNIE